MINVHEEKILDDDHDHDNIVDSEGVDDFLDDWDSYMEEINNRLTISRMVNDSLVKGMVKAIEEKSSDIIASKDEEIKDLKRRLKIYESSICSKEKVGDLKAASQNYIQKLKEDVGFLRSADHGKSLQSLIEINSNIDVLEEIFDNLLRYCSDMNSDEQLWQGEIQKEFNVFIIEEKLRELSVEFEMKLCEQRSLFDSRYNFWSKKIEEIKELRRELEFISKSMLFVEQEHHHHHLSSGLQESYEEWIHIKNTDDFSGKSNENSDIFEDFFGKNVFEDGNSSLLAHMSKEELMSYYNAEIREIKRQLESSVHEKTEELFRLKRKIFKERDLFFSKREKEMEALKKRIPDLNFRLDEVLNESKNFSNVECDDQTVSLQRRIIGLLLENKTLHNLLTEERKKLRNMVERYSAMDKTFRKEKRDLEHELENLKVEAFLFSQTQDSIFNQLVHDASSREEESRIECDITGEVFNSIVEVLIIDAQILAKLNVLYKKEKDDLTANIFQKDLVLKSEIEKSKKLSDELDRVEKIKKELLAEKDFALSTEIKRSKELIHETSFLRDFMAEKDKCILELESKLRRKEDLFHQQVEDFSEQEISLFEFKFESDVLRCTLYEASNVIRESLVRISDLEEKNMCILELESKLRRKEDLFHRQVEDFSEQEVSLFEFKFESDVLRCRLYEASDVIRESFVRISDLEENLLMARSNIQRLEVDCGRFYDIIREKESIISLDQIRLNKQAEKMESMADLVQTMSKSFNQFEKIILPRLERQNWRLERFLFECDCLSKLASTVKLRTSQNEKELKIILSNYGRAENEVDCLGDEVDDLVSVLERVYIALDHYSPVLQHYTGVMEMLELVKRKLHEVNGEAD